jgi:histidinol-phosphate aminotransferase
MVRPKIRESVCRLKGYVPGKSVEYVRRKYGVERVIKLASNENPYGASRKAVEALGEFKDLHVYPPTQPDDLVERISDYLGIESTRIVIGSGIDGILEATFNIFVERGDTVSIAPPTFPYYFILAHLYDARIERLERDRNFQIKGHSKAKLTLICSPNNPTGNLERKEIVKTIVEESNGLVFIDEAYAEFASENLLEFSEYENVVIARTFSKAFGLASLRIGYAVVPEWVKKEYLKVLTPFPVSTPAIKAAIAALDDLDHANKVMEKIKKERQRVFEELSRLGVNVFPSEANFLFMKVKPNFCEEMMKRGIIVRDCSEFEGCAEGDVRVSIGREEENNYFLEKTAEVLRVLKS